MRMNNKETPIKLFISSAIKSQSKPSLVNPIMRAPPLMTDLLKYKGLQPKPTNSAFTGHQSLSPLTLCFDCKTTIERETQTQKVIVCEVDSQTVLLVADKQTQTESNAIDLQLIQTLHQNKEFVENSTQTSEISQFESDFKNCEPITSIESSESSETLFEFCQNSSETEIRSSTFSETSKMRVDVIEEINSLETIANNVNYAQNIIEKTMKNEMKSGEIVMNSISKSENIKKYWLCCSIS